MSRRRPHDLVRLVLLGSLACSILLGGLAAWRGLLSWKALAALAGGAVAVWICFTWLHRRGRFAGLFVSVSILNLLLVVPELALRVAGFRQDVRAQFDLSEFVPDAERFWKLDPSRAEVNSWGFPGEEVVRPKPEGVFRIAFLGDSCAQWGEPLAYPAIVQRIFEQRGPGSVRVESVSLAVAGYTSWQGTVVAETFGTIVAPDVAVICYGWNDHWLAFGSPDADAHGRASAAADLLASALQSSRLVGWARSALGSGRAHRRPPDLRQMLGARLSGDLRVGPDEFRDNLLRIAAVFAEGGVPVVYLTAPSAHRQLGVPRQFVSLDYATDTESVIDLHTRYAEIVREVASESGQRLLDLEREMSSLARDRIAELFLADGIHLRQAGCELIAARVAEFLQGELGIQ